MKKAIVTDIDQVALDYASRLREYVNETYGRNIQGHSEDWNLTEWLQCSSYEETLGIISEFSQKFEFGTLDAFPGSDVVFHSLINKGYALIGLTACGTLPITVALRKANIFHRFGDIFEEIHFVEFNDSKVEKVADISTRYDIAAFIDDKPDNVMDILYGTEVDKVILMKAPHNRKFREDNVLPVHYAFSWYDCKNLILNEIGVV